VGLSRQSAAGVCDGLSLRPFPQRRCRGGRYATEAWTAAETDALHRASWVTGTGRGGGKALQVGVAPGAPHRWAQWRPEGIPVAVGQTYELAGWVRTEGLHGSAGWFIHLHDEAGAMVLNRHVTMDDADRDWTRLALSFTAPTGAVRATVGTFLRGEGKVRYDDAEWRIISGLPEVRVAYGGEEGREIPPFAPPRSDLRPGGKVTARVRMVRTAPAERSTLAVADLRPAGGRWLGGNPAGRAKVFDAAGRSRGFSSSTTWWRSPLRHRPAG